MQKAEKCFFPFGRKELFEQSSPLYIIRRCTVRFALITISTAISMVVLGAGALLAKEVPHHDKMVDISEPRICLNCHEGGLDEDKFYCTSTAHPVFIDYPPEGKAADFAHPEELQAAGLKLLNGQLICVSCHNLENQQQYHLVVEKLGSKLCMTCHSKMGR